MTKTPGNQTERPAVLVLAAGGGKRAGGPKALVPTRDGPWWKVQDARVRAAGLAATWVVSDRVARAMRESGESAASLVIGDPRAPMFVSFLLGLRSLEDQAGRSPGGVFVLPVDTPAPTDARVWKTLSNAGGVAVPEFEGTRGHPVYLPREFVERTLRETVPRAADPASLRLDRLIAPVVTAVPVSDPAVAWNLNSPNDFRDYLASVSGRSGTAVGPS